MPEEAARVFINQGVLGSAVILEAAAIVWLFFRLDKQQKTIENRDAVIAALQEKRVEEGATKTERVVEAIKDVTGSNVRLTEVVIGFRTFIESGAWRRSK